MMTFKDRCRMMKWNKGYRILFCIMEGDIIHERYCTRAEAENQLKIMKSKGMENLKIKATVIFEDES